MGSTRRAFTYEYKRNAVSLVLEDGRTVADVARGIGMKPQTLGRWGAKNQGRGRRPARAARPQAIRAGRARTPAGGERPPQDAARVRKKVSAWFARGQRR
ncbi:MAG: transposase [Propionibacteriaceae bacterium]|nr:transposase [Propionibacteriaceae bacterium]